MSIETGVRLPARAEAITPEWLSRALSGAAVDLDAIGAIGAIAEGATP
jgi:hypothetical protein